MDKYEYQVCADQIKALIAEKKFVEAMDIADTIDWRRVKSVSMLCTVSEIYKANKRYEESQDILLLAYERYPTGRNIIYALCELSIKMKDIVQAIEYYKEYTRVAPEDTSSYILLYKIYEAQDVTIEERIEVLEEFKKRDYREKWAYELATLYHKIGLETKCVETCDELIIWFGEGKYVQKAMELKMQHANLSGDQQRKYDNQNQLQSSQLQQNANASQGYSMQQSTGSMAQNAAVQYGGYQGYNGQSGYGMSSFQPNDASRYNTVNLQEELTKSVNAYNLPGADANMGLYGNMQQAQAYYDIPVLSQPAQQNVYGQPTYEQPVAVTPGYEPIYSAVQYAQEMYKEQQEQAQSQPEEAAKAEETEVKRPSMQETVHGTEQAQVKTVKKYDTLYAQEYDGQISMSLPDPEMVEKQITGQLNIEDILKGWETQKAENDQKRVDEAKKKSLEKTSDILSQLQGVIPGSGGVLPSGRMMTLDEEYGGNLKQIREEDKNLLKSEEADVNTEVPVEEVSVSEKNAEESEATESVENSEFDFAPIEYDLEAEETQRVEGTVEEEPETETMPEAAKESRAETEIETEAEAPVAVEEELPEISLPEDIAAEVEAEAEAEIEQEEVVEEIAEPVAENAEDMQPAKEPEARAEVETESESEAVPELVVPQSNSYEMDDYGEVEEIAEIEQPEIDQQMYAEQPMADQYGQPLQMPQYGNQMVQEMQYENPDFVKAYEPKRNVPGYMRRGDSVRARRQFTPEEEATFIYFAQIEPLKAQIVEVLDTISLDSYHGNVIVMGSENCDRKELTISVVRAVQQKFKDFSGKVAKITGEALNKKNIPVTLKKLVGGALIVENCGELTRESVNALTGALSSEQQPILVVLDGTRESVEAILNTNAQMDTVFDCRIEMDKFSTNDLVAYGMGYASKNEYSFDDMGVLALYNRIEDMQAFDHVVSVEEVKDVVDDAIRHVDRRNFSHFVDILLGRRYDDDDRIILREKDFMA